MNQWKFRTILDRLNADFDFLLVWTLTLIPCRSQNPFNQVSLALKFWIFSFFTYLHGDLIWSCSTIGFEKTPLEITATGPIILHVFSLKLVNAYFTILYCTFLYQYLRFTKWSLKFFCLLNFFHTVSVMFDFLLWNVCLWWKCGK